MIMIIMFSNP